MLAWAESSPRLLQRRGLPWAARVSPLVLLGLALAQVTGLLGWPVWLPFLFADAILWQLLSKDAFETLSHISTQAGAFRQYADAFELLATATLDAPVLKRLLGTLTTDGRSASAHMRHLERLTRFVLPRGALVYWIVQSVLARSTNALRLVELLGLED